MAWIQHLPTLTMASGSTTSTILSQSSYGWYDALSFFISGTQTGNLSVEITHDTNSGFWPTMITSVSSSNIIVMESFPYDGIRFSANASQSNNVTIYTMGQIQGVVGNNAINVSDDC